MSEKTDNGRLAALVFGLAFLAGLFAWWMSLAPSPLPADAQATEFSAHRAIKHIERMALEPHPGGSHANEQVYQYIIAALEAMDIEMCVDRPVMRMKNRRRSVERNGAILARVRGTASTGAFAVDAHFDSTPYGPGAADDLSGVAAMLETIRALKAGSPLMNDIVFCFADKEETRGEGGPGVFIRHEWFKDVKAVLGLEARGTSGPAVMFETGPENGFLIRQLAQSGARPRANSSMFDFYDRMPFGSDFTRYKRLGLPGMNVAYIDDFCNYHTKLDVPENVSLASLQHHGYYTLGLAQRLGNIPLGNCKAPDATYFNTIGSHMVIYPRTWGKPLAIAMLLFLAAVLVFGFVRRRLSVGGMLAAIGVYLLSVLVSFALTAPISAALYFKFQEHALYRNDMLSLAITLIGAGTFVLLTRPLRNRVRPESMLAGVLVLWAALLVLMQRYAPGGAYGAAWPILFLALGLLTMLLSRHDGQPSKATLAASALGSLPVILLLVPAFVMFTYTLTALAVPGLLFLFLLLPATLMPQMTLIPLRRHVPIGIAIMAAGALLCGLAVLSNTPSPSRPRQNCLSYAVNFDNGEAWWISGDTKLDEWTRNFFSEDTPRVSIEAFLGEEDDYAYLRAPAPQPPFGKTVLRKLEDNIEGGRRKLKFFIDSPRDAQRIDLHLESNARVFKARALGIKVGGAGRGWDLSLDTIPFEGGELELEVEPNKPLRFLIREVSFKLPELPNFPPRPDYMMTETNRVLNRSKELRSNHTFSICTYTF